MKRLFGSIKLYDMVALYCITTTLAFHDLYAIFLIGQIIFFAFSVYFLARKHSESNKMTKFMLLWYTLFFIFSMSSVMWSINDKTWNTIMISIGQVAVLGFSVITYAKDEIHIKRMILYIICASLLLTLRLIIFVPASAWGTERVGNYINYGNVGVTYVLGYSSLMAFYIFRKEKKKRYIIISILLIVVSCLTGTKKGIIVYLVGVFFIMISNKRNILKSIKNILIFIVIIWISYMALMKVDILYSSIGVRFETAIEQISGDKKDADKSTRDRALLIQYAKKAFFKSPFVGIGIDAFRHYGQNPLRIYAHNNYMEILADLGICGFVLYYWLPFYSVYILRKQSKNDECPYSVLAFALLTALLIGDFSSVSYYQEPLQIYLGFVYAIVLCYTTTKQKKMEVNDE